MSRSYMRLGSEGEEDVSHFVSSFKLLLLLWV
jgi:hypothetical protein